MSARGASAARRFGRIDVLLALIVVMLGVMLVRAGGDMDDRERRTAMLKLERAYDPPGPEDGPRFLVDRLWPRGVKKENLKLDAWLKDVAPSDELRRWFGHDPAKWEAFQRRYVAELDGKPQAWQPLLDAARQGEITLVYGARDPQHNNAAALKAYLEHRLTVQEAGHAS